MDALLSQEIGFFDVTKTGDITSRLSSDTTLVGDQVMLNVNVFLRSLVQATVCISPSFLWVVASGSDRFRFFLVRESCCLCFLFPGN